LSEPHHERANPGTDYEDLIPVDKWKALGKPYNPEGEYHAKQYPRCQQIEDGGQRIPGVPGVTACGHEHSFYRGV
jgi:hypothetical protein